MYSASFLYVLAGLTIATSNSQKIDSVNAQDLRKRDGNCAPQPSGSGPVSTPDTAAAFRSSSALSVNDLNAFPVFGHS